MLMKVAIPSMKYKLDTFKKLLFSAHSADEKNVSFTELEAGYMQLFLFKQISC